MAKILIVDDEPVVCDVLKKLLAGPEREVLAADDVSKALRLAEGAHLDVAILDKNLRGDSGLELLGLLRENQHDMEAIIITGFSTTDSAIEALRANAFDYITKPFEPQEIENKVNAAIERVAGKRQRHARIRQLYKMESIGTLAASVGHEINNPLTYIIGNLEHLSERLPELELAAGTSTELRSVIDDAREGADRVRLIVRELRLFARTYHEEKTQRISVLETLASSIRLVENELRHRAILVRALDEVPDVSGGSIRLSQVLVNVLFNAAQAIPEGNASGHEVEVQSHTDEDGNAVVTVRDTGVGIPEEDLPHIFDRFYTTKAEGEGMGLGLALSKRFVEELGGTISVESTVGEGTRVTLVLPPARDPAPAKPVVREPAPAKLVPGRILIIDDDKNLARSLQRGLQGHEVVMVASGRAALEHLATDSDFDVILCDLMMPDVSGADVYAELTKTHPELAREMILMTGGTFSRRAREFEESVGNRVMDKPIPLRDVRGLLSARASRRIDDSDD